MMKMESLITPTNLIMKDGRFTPMGHFTMKFARILQDGVEKKKEPLILQSMKSLSVR